MAKIDGKQIKEGTVVGGMYNTIDPELILQIPTYATMPFLGTLYLKGRIILGANGRIVGIK